MRIEPTPRPDHALRVSARLITSSTILHLSADELERTVNQEQTENPALEVAERHICLFCGTPLHGQTCTACGRFATQTTAPLNTSNEALTSYELPNIQWAAHQIFYDIDNYSFTETDNDEEYDQMARIPTENTLAEVLLQQLEALVTPDDAPIAEQLTGSLDERGYLEGNPQEIAEHIQVPIERVMYVLSQLQTLEPLGVGARDVRECLLIQLRALSELETPHPLAYTLVDNYLEALGNHRYHEIARRLRVSEQEVRMARRYIRSTLHPYPAHIYRGLSHPSGSGTTYIHPDVVIRKSETNFEVELIEDKRYRFGIRTSYANVAEQQVSELSNNDVKRYIHQHRDRARFFVECVQRRWQTLKMVAEQVVEYQKEFLEKGVRSLQPLTRAEIAQRLHLDEGTVSRAIANKYVLLPNGRLIPLSDFFDGSLRIKDLLRELIQCENTKHPLSDEELAHRLAAHDIQLARRTVAKYREEMGIGSSRERG